MQVGEVVLIDDVVTGYDRMKPARPCMVVRAVERPRAGALVVPRSTQGSAGTFVPASALAGLTKDGRFMVLPRFVAAQELRWVKSLGVLRAPWRQQVLDNVNDVAFDLKSEL